MRENPTVNENLTVRNELLSDEEIEQVELSKEEYKALSNAMESYQPECFKGAFFNAEESKLRKRKIAQAQLLKCHQAEQERIGELINDIDNMLESNDGYTLTCYKSSWEYLKSKYLGGQK